MNFYGWFFVVVFGACVFAILWLWWQKFVRGIADPLGKKGDPTGPERGFRGPE